MQMRSKQLRETGVTEKENVALSPPSPGREMTVIVQVMLDPESCTRLDAFKRRMRNAPAVPQCYYITGEVEFILVVVKDIEEDEAFTEE